MATTASQVLTDGYFVTNYQATTTGYYHIMFGGTERGSKTTRMVTVEQTGRGGSNLYRHDVSHDLGMNWEAESPAHFDAWLAEQIPFAAATMRALGFEDFAEVVEARGTVTPTEWQDIVCMAICEAIESRQIPAPRRKP